MVLTCTVKICEIISGGSQTLYRNEPVIIKLVIKRYQGSKVLYYSQQTEVNTWKTLKHILNVNYFK